MAITNFIPTVWSETLLSNIDRKYIAVSNCNREFEGEIKGKGATVKICGVGGVSIGNYTKNSDMGEPQTLSDTVQELTIDQAKYFNFQIDDIDKAQCTPKLMEAAMKLAANGLANAADEYIYNLYDQAGKRIDCNETNIINSIIYARKHLFQQNVTDASDIVVELSPDVANTLLLEKAELLSNNNELLENGCIGSVAGCKVYVSNNVYQNNIAGVVTHKCYVRTKRAIAFAEQLSEITAYRPEKRFADAVKGLYLYGAKVVYPNELVVLDFTLPEE